MNDAQPCFMDATEEFQRYRMMLREIWNSYVFQDPDMRDWDIVEKFDQVSAVLAEKLLHEKLRRKLNIDDELPLNVLVIPAMNLVPIRISETLEKPGSRNWNQEPTAIGPWDMVLTFRDFFDWGQLNYRDLQFFLVEITGSDRFPALIGREALVEVSCCRIKVFSACVTDELFNQSLDQPTQ